MGAAGHVHSPAGGQGMNTGIVDAIVLGQLLTRAIRSASDAVLKSYHQLRQPAAKQVLALAGRLTSFRDRSRRSEAFRSQLCPVADRRSSVGPASVRDEPVRAQPKAFSIVAA
jgi:2-polyprenyl-6-methoxyphenol hydroxylase-like FAD-dependent oxidoreductase